MVELSVVLCMCRVSKLSISHSMNEKPDNLPKHGKNQFGVQLENVNMARAAGTW